MRNIILLLPILILVGCGTAKTLVLQPPETTAKYSDVKVVSDNPTVAVPEEIRIQMNTAIEQGFLQQISLFGEMN